MSRCLCGGKPWCGITKWLYDVRNNSISKTIEPRNIGKQKCGEVMSFSILEQLHHTALQA